MIDVPRHSFVVISNHTSYYCYYIPLMLMLHTTYAHTYMLYDDRRRHTYTSHQQLASQRMEIEVGTNKQLLAA
jgi:1-acyl-sn-glycerol-3-phosphate acyltransferase